MEIKKIEKSLEALKYRVDKAELLSDIYSLCACTISIACDLRTRARRLEELQRIERKYKPEEQAIMQEVMGGIYTLCAGMAEPDGVFNDWLGELYMRSETNSGKNGQFFTPYSIAVLTSEMGVTPEPGPDGIFTIDEPACGSGGMILAAVDRLRKQGVNYAERVFAHGADLDARCVRMCYTQLSLAGIPAVVHQRDTLSMRTIDEWATPAYTFNYLRFSRYGERA